jgi:hypothetical protein
VVIATGTRLRVDWVRLILDVPSNSEAVDVICVGRGPWPFAISVALVDLVSLVLFLVAAESETIDSSIQGPVSAAYFDQSHLKSGSNPVKIDFNLSDVSSISRWTHSYCGIPNCFTNTRPNRRPEVITATPVVQLFRNIRTSDLNHERRGHRRKVI